MLKLLHAADVHLDSPRGGIERVSDAPVDAIRQAPRRALENLVRLAVAEKVDAVLLAGDLYDGDWKDFRTGLFFVEQTAKLHDAGIPVFLIAGNHDASNKMTRSLRLPPNVHFFSADRPSTQIRENLGLAVHGQSFATAAVLDDLSAGYPDPIRGLFNVGLLHTCATSTEHERYAPCTIEGLRLRGYDYWALGHVHQRQTLLEEPFVVFPGNIQGRHAKETGAKGCVLVHIDDRERVRCEFKPLDVFRWERCRVDASQAETPAEVVDRTSVALRKVIDECDGRPLATRIELVGACRAHEALVADSRRWDYEIRGAAAQIGGDNLWIEKVLRDTRPAATGELEMDGPVGELLELLRDYRSDPASMEELQAVLSPLAEKLPGELSLGPEPFQLASPERVARLLDDVEQLLLHRLRGEEAVR
jgi:DNA repair exonuclease SbcCD nuclease subunit